MTNLQTQHAHVDRQPTTHKYASLVIESVDMLAADKKKKRPWANKEFHKTFSTLGCDNENYCLLGRDAVYYEKSSNSYAWKTNKMGHFF